jgi:Domain of unknown function (DUF1987).
MFEIQATSSTPRVSYDEASRTLSIVGESYPENSFEFYAPVFELLQSAIASASSFRLSLEVDYMNSSSTKCVLDILDMLCDAAAKGCDARVTWLYDAGNERALDLAEEFKEDIEIPFDLVPKGESGL